MKDAILNLRNLTAAVLTCGCLTGSAAIFVTGSPNVLGGPSSVQITADITFTITISGTVNALIFDNWVATEDAAITVLPLLSGGITYQIDAGSAQTLGTTELAMIDNMTVNSGSLTPTDGLFVWSPGIAVTAGQTFRINAGTLNFGGSPEFNPQTIGTFTGNVFLTGSGGSPLSGVASAVPEPEEEAACAALGLIAFGAWRWKARRARKAS